MKRLRFAAAMLVIAGLCLPGVAGAETLLKAEVDKTALTTAEPVTYKLILQSSERNLPHPKFPSFKGFAVVSQAQSSTMLFQKGAAKTVLVYVFILLAKEPGTLDIGPAQVTVQGKTLDSESFSLKVTAAEGRIEPLPGKLPDSQEPRYTL